MNDASSASPLRLDRLIGVAVWLLTIGYLLPRAFRGWIPHDEGLLGQLGERTLRGDLPHVDFLDPYTGGLSFLYAGAFDVLGISAQSIRWVLLAAVALVVPFLFAVTRRFAPAWLAALATLTAVAWSVPAYFAGLPSWYGLFLAIIALWALLRHSETGQRRWVVLAGFCGGLSCTFKITGLYLIAGALLALVDHEHHAARSRAAGRVGVKDEGDSASGRAFVALSGFGAAGFVLGLVALVRPSFGPDGGSGSIASLILHFVLPGGLLAGYLVVREARAGIRVTSPARLRRLAGLTGWLLLGVAVPVALYVGLFAWRGGLPALADLYNGVFVLPKKRFAFATFPLPPAWTLFLALPLGAWAVWPRRVGPKVQVTAGGLIVVALALSAALAGQDAVYRVFWLPLRALVPVVILGGVVALARSRSTGGVGKRDEQLFAVLAMTGLVSLIQYPDAYGIYFLYVAPLAVVAWLALSAIHPHAWRTTLLAVFLCAGTFAVGWLHRGHPGVVGLGWLPATWDFELVMPRGGLEVDRNSGIQAHLVTQAVLDHAVPGDAIFAAPDCPEIPFLTGTRDPLRSFFSFFDGEIDDAADLEALLARENVKVAVINQAPNFSPPLSEPVLSMLERRYPNERIVGRMMVRW